MGRRINLVPQSERARTTTDFGMLAMLAMVVIVIFGVGLAYFMFNGRLDSKQQELADVQQQVTQLRSQVASLDQYAELSAQRERAETLVQQVYANRTLVASLLNSVSLVVPEDAWFSSVDIQTKDPIGQAAQAGPATASDAQNVITLEGNTYSFEGVAQVMVRLKLIPLLTDVVLVSAGPSRGDTDPAKDVKGFTLSGRVLNDQPEDVPLPVSQAEVVTP
jgi:Tfp pilus assembly protein PilN